MQGDKMIPTDLFEFAYVTNWYLLPVCLTNMVKPDLAMTLSVMDGYYLGNTCLTLEMAYLNARMIAHPTAGWLTDLVK